MLLAEWTGLEPATPGVTGRYSNQLNYHSSFANPKRLEWRRTGRIIAQPSRLGRPQGVRCAYNLRFWFRVKS